MITETDYAWLAGFIDGEGCFYHQKPGGTVRGRGGICLRIGQKDRRVLDRVVSIAGGSIYETMRITKLTPVRHLMYDYYLGGKNLEFLIDKLWPNLGTIKRAQYNQVVARYNSGPGGPQLVDTVSKF